MSRFISWILLSLMFFLLHNNLAFAQCPEKVVLEDAGLDNSGSAEVRVFDNFENNVDITDLEINIFNELTGSYIFTESRNLPNIGTSEAMNISKQNNRIIINDIPDDIDLLKCEMVFVGGDCPPKAVTITAR